MATHAVKTKERKVARSRKFNGVAGKRHTKSQRKQALEALAKRICDDSESIEDFAKATGSDHIQIAKIEGYDNNY